MKRGIESILAVGFICVLIGIAGISGAIETGIGMKLSVGITLIGLSSLYFGISGERRGESEKKNIGSSADCRDAD